MTSSISVSGSSLPEHEKKRTDIVRALAIDAILLYMERQIIVVASGFCNLDK
jgi:hypothetical protein